MNVEELVSQGRDALIELAAERLRDQGFSNFEPKHFDRISVKTDGTEVIVTFRMAIEYVPLNSCYIYGATVRILEKFISWAPKNNTGSDEAKATEVFVPSQEIEKNLKSLLKILRINLPIPDDTTFTIIEMEEYYQIEEMSKWEAVFYKLTKNTHQFFDEWYEELVLDEEPEEDYQEIE
jgi:hypothetical protein